MGSGGGVEGESAGGGDMFLSWNMQMYAKFGMVIDHSYYELSGVFCEFM